MAAYAPTHGCRATSPDRRRRHARARAAARVLAAGDARSQGAVGPQARRRRRHPRPAAHGLVLDRQRRHADLDQLSVAEPLAGGSTRLRVAIADVDALVRAGSAIDGHAATNTTSVYTAAGVFPMLPEILSTDLTSLHEGQERLAVVVEMEVAAGRHGGGHADLSRRVCRTTRSSPTTRVGAWLDGARRRAAACRAGRSAGAPAAPARRADAARCASGGSGAAR